MYSYYYVFGNASLLVQHTDLVLHWYSNVSDTYNVECLYIDRYLSSRSQNNLPLLRWVFLSVCLPWHERWAYCDSVVVASESGLLSFTTKHNIQHQRLKWMHIHHRPPQKNAAVKLWRWNNIERPPLPRDTKGRVKDTWPSEYFRVLQKVL